MCVSECVCVFVFVCVGYAFSVWETGNYLQFAEKANLSLTMVLKLQYTAGAAYKKALSIFSSCMCVCVWWEKRRRLFCLCVCVYHGAYLNLIMLMAQLTLFFLWGVVKHCVSMSAKTESGHGCTNVKGKCSYSSPALPLFLYCITHQFDKLDCVDRDHQERTNCHLMYLPHLNLEVMKIMITPFLTEA